MICQRLTMEYCKIWRDITGGEKGQGGGEGLTWPRDFLTLGGRRAESKLEQVAITGLSDEWTLNPSLAVWCGIMTDDPHLSYKLIYHFRCIIRYINGQWLIKSTSLNSHEIKYSFFSVQYMPYTVYTVSAFLPVYVYTCASYRITQWRYTICSTMHH